MTEIGETIGEAIEKGVESRLNAIIAALVAVTATFMAVCNVKGGNVVQAMTRAQANAVDTWAYYQAKSTKQNLAEAMSDEMATQRDMLPSAATASQRSTLDKRIADYQANVKRYESEKEEIKKQALAFEKQYDLLNIRDDQFDMAEAGMSLGIALLGLTALTRKKWLLAVALVFAGFGVLLGLAGFAGWNLHPEWLAKLLG
ncbi:MAG TPA: DUF4337 domain-containing protein, partial [Polyangia bacterium]|nr:DUF4337 domain-containing protein [Polyangia bacterium]